MKDFVKKFVCNSSSLVFTSLDPDLYDIFGILDPDPQENLCGSETLACTGGRHQSKEPHFPPPLAPIGGTKGKCVNYVPVLLQKIKNYENTST